MNTRKAAKRPPIRMIEEEAEMLANLAVSVEDRLPEVSRMLLDEIDRATTCSADKIAPDVVTMHATVEFIDEARSAPHKLQLVYPKDADIAAGRISILTPVGAGLIGLRTGQSILWPDRKGEEHRLTIVGVEQRGRATQEPA